MERLNGKDSLAAQETNTWTYMFAITKYASRNSWNVFWTFATAAVAG